MTERFHIIHLGNPYDFVVKDHTSNKTYGTFQGDSVALKECFKDIEKEMDELKQENLKLRMSPRVDVNEIESLVCENEQLKAENEELREENKSWLKTASRMDTIHHEDREYCEKVHRENEKLKQENQQYKSILQDMGLLISGDDEITIRNTFADKIIKPIFAESGFDVDVDTSNGFAISLKEEKE